MATEIAKLSLVVDARPSAQRAALAELTAMSDKLREAAASTAAAQLAWSRTADLIRRWDETPIPLERPRFERVDVSLPGFRYTRAGRVGVCRFLGIEVRWIGSLLRIHRASSTAT